MKNILLVGNGSWGQKIVVCCQKMKDIKLKIANRNDWKQEIEKNPDGVIVATPPESHVEIASFALERKIRTFIEKPLSLSSEEAKKLKLYENNAVILVNHLHLFSPALLQIQKRLNSSSEFLNITSCGMNKTHSKTYSSLFDYGSHDVAMSLFFSSNIAPKIIKASQEIRNEGKNFSFTLKYPGILHNVKVGNAADEKVRRFSVKCSEFTYLYDDVSKEKLFINGKAVSFYPQISTLEASLSAFLSATDNDDIRFGLDLPIQVVEVLEKIQENINNN